MILQRQIATFLRAGLDVSVVDQCGQQADAEPLAYEHRRVTPGRWEPVVKNAWRVVRRLPGEASHNRFWQCVLWLRAASNATRMARVALHQRADCYVAADLRAVWAALLARRVRRRPVLYSAYEIESEQGAGQAIEIQKAFLRSLERRFVPQVDHLVVPNAARGEWYREQYATRRHPVVVRNCPPAQAPIESDKLRGVLRLDSSARIVLYHGALIPHRALENLVRSAASFDDHIVLVFLGEQGDYYRHVLLPLTEHEQLQDRVFFLPYVAHNEVLSYVASADLGVVIYDNVNLNNYFCAPTKLYEYVMMDVPVAACAFPGLVDFMERYPVGRTFDPQDPISIARAINTHFSQRSQEGRNIERALAEARRRFNWERESQKWLDLLNGERTQ